MGERRYGRELFQREFGRQLGGRRGGGAANDGAAGGRPPNGGGQGQCEKRQGRPSGQVHLADLDRSSRPGALCAAGAAIATLGARARLPNSVAVSRAAFPPSRPLRAAAVRADKMNEACGRRIAASPLCRSRVELGRESGFMIELGLLEPQVGAGLAINSA